MTFMQRIDQAGIAPSVTFNPFLSLGRYIVATKADDPLIRTARARQIWAANTAAATQALGVPTSLVGDVSKSDFPIESIAGISAAKRCIAQLYNVATNFELSLVNVKKLITDNEQQIPAAWVTSIFPQAGLVHTRDPAIAIASDRRGINFVLEHHDEDYQCAFKGWKDLAVNRPNCRAIVAITQAVKETLLNQGVPEEKILVLDSGVNSSAASSMVAEARNWRNYFLGNYFENLVVYSGGMQFERGIPDILHAAQAMADTMFIFCGGHAADVAQWRPLIETLRLSNVRLLGYLPHHTMCEIQQAADVLLLSRSADGRPAITSPLKFFEYLMAGKPIVAARIPVTERFSDQELCLQYYDAGIVSSMILAIRKSLSTYKFGHIALENTALAYSYTWEQRQTRLMNFVGYVCPRTTF
ncbi:glycosyltransferase [Croceibacterium ferulae]|uniref:glycosyltransferase n=1 Tax=Croceibacterium ferulae TaxID=1854641 RepID=UPI000EAF5651|nr:glycosyltransferase [Croceibacterium ferulae]